MAINRCTWPKHVSATMPMFQPKLPTASNLNQRRDLIQCWAAGLPMDTLQALFGTSGRCLKTCFSALHATPRILLHLLSLLFVTFLQDRPDGQSQDAWLRDLYTAIKPTGGEPMLTGSIPGLVPQLRPYQSRAAAWMVGREVGPHTG